MIHPLPDDPGTLPDLAVDRLGGAAVTANDEFFAPRDNLVHAAPPVWDADRYTDRGKWMDGWETRRRREPGHDWCIVRLGVPGVIHRAVIDTAHFTGNFPPRAGLDGVVLPTDASPARLAAADWTTLVDEVDLGGDRANVVDLDDEVVTSHVRLRIVPDGGVARLRLHGVAAPAWPGLVGAGRVLDLAALEHGGRVLDVSDRFYSHPGHLLLPGPARGMFDGWETRRRRDDGNDWVEIGLGVPGTVTAVVLDTSHFKGNAPGAARVRGRRDGGDWVELVARVPLQPHTPHRFEVEPGAVVDAVRVDVFPDGGLARVRVVGTPDPRRVPDLALWRLDRLPPPAAAAELRTCNGSSAWVERMVAARPFGAPAELRRTADAVWAELGRDDVLEAFDAHPRIGERSAGTDTGEQARRWSGREQSGVADDDRAELARVNRAYEDRFGWIFLICATGLDSGRILERARERMGNDPGTEFAVATEEQRRITQLRLAKLLGEAVT